MRAITPHAALHPLTENRMNDTTIGAGTDTAEHWCPRRVELIHQTPGPDTWDSRAGLSGGIGPSCSHCGSLSPDVFMAKIREGWIVEPTDKGYKAYLDQPYTAEELESIKTGSAIWQHARMMKLDEGLTDEEAAAAANAHWSKYEAPEHKGRTVAKFYYQHLSQEQRTEFLELHNSGAMRLSYPGHFYVRPYFAQTADKAANDA